MNIDPRYKITIIQDKEAGEEQQTALPNGIANGEAQKDTTLTIVEGYLPQQFEISANSEYDAPYAEGIMGNFGARGKLLAQAFLGKLTTQAMSFQFWSGSTPMELSLPITFVARHNTIEDVRTPIVKLLKLTLPSAAGFDTALGIQGDSDIYRLLQPPGPKITFDKERFIKATGSSEASVLDIAIKLGEGNFGQAFSAIGSVLSHVGSKGVAIALNPFQFLKFTNNIQISIGQMLRFPSVVITSVSATYDTKFDDYGRAIKATVNVTFRTFFTPTKQDIDRMFLLTQEGAK